MSLFRVRSKLFTSMPRIYVEDGVFVAETPLYLCALSLFLYIRTVTVNRAQRFVEISVRRFWFFEEVTYVPFKRIKCLFYDFWDAPTSAIVYPRWVMVTDTMERYRIGIVLNKPNGERHKLFDIYGEGAVDTGVLGVLLGDELIDVEGTQQAESLRWVDFLSRFIGVPVGDLVGR